MFNTKSENIIMTSIMKAPRTLLDRVIGRKTGVSDRMVNHFASQYETLDEHVYRCGDEDIKELYLSMEGGDKRTLTSRLRYYSLQFAQVEGIKVDNKKATYAKPFLDMVFKTAFTETLQKLEMRAKGFKS